MHLQSTHTSHLKHLQLDPNLEPDRKSMVGLFWKNSYRVKAVGCFRGGAPSLIFDRILNATLSEEGVSTTGFNSHCLLILLIHTKHKTIKWCLRMTPRLHLLEGALIHWVDKAKNMWPIVKQFPIKIGWWDAPLGLRDLSQSNKHEVLPSRSGI